MTLFNKIALIFSVFLILLLGTVMFLNFKTSAEFVQNQLYTDAEDTATSLGLSLSTAVGAGDVTMMETMINAVFDRGYYQEMRLTDIDGNVLIDKELDVKVKSVPQWFVELVNLEIPHATVEVSAGWMPFGELLVRGHGGHGYLQLWHTFTRISLWFAALSAIVLVSLYILLKIVLRSLEDVRRQAEAVKENQFLIVEDIPSTKEFKSVVLAMNMMVSKVKGIFEREAATLNKYHHLLYHDGLTGLYNRRYYMTELANLLGSETGGGGSVALLSLNDIGLGKKRLGYEKLDWLIKDVAEAIQRHGKKESDGLAARLSGQDFALLLPGTGGEEALGLVKGLLAELEQLVYEYGIDAKQFYFCAGVGEFGPEETQKNLLSKTDYALAGAKNAGPFQSRLHEEGKEEGLILGKEEWAKEIADAIAGRRIKLAVQSAKGTDGTVFHDEVYLRLQDKEGKIHAAGYFMPVLINLGLVNTVDKHVMELALEHLDAHPEAAPIAVNLSPAFIKDGSILYWLTQALKERSRKQQGRKLSFEIANAPLLKEMEVCKEFASVVKEHGCSLGIDNFSPQTGDLGYLRDLRPDYIKMHKEFLLSLEESEEAKTAYNALQTIAESLGILFVATAVETAEEKAALERLGITRFQGSLIGKITMLGGAADGQ